MKTYCKTLIIIVFLVISLIYIINNRTYAYSSIIYRDDGKIELNASDLPSLSTDELEKVVQLSFSGEVPSNINPEIYQSLINLEDIYITRTFIDDITFINQINSNKDINIYILSSIVNFNGINNEHIKALSLGNCEVSNFKSVEALSSLTTLGFSEMIGYEELDYTKFPNLSSLTAAVHIDDFEKLISSIPNITYLSLASSNIQNKDAVHLSGLTNLKSLNLNNTYLTDIDFVSSIPSLEEIVLPWAVTDFSPIYDLPNLNSILWEAYSELFVTEDFVDYLDSKNIFHYEYNPNINKEVSDIIDDLNLTKDSDPKMALEKISKYLVENTKTENDGTISGNFSELDNMLTHHFGVCYGHSIAVYTIAKVLGINDVYAVGGILRQFYDYINPEESTDVTDEVWSIQPHAWNVINDEGIWYGIDAAQMNTGTLSIDDFLFEANFYKNPFKDDDYSYDYAMSNYYDYNYNFSSRHKEDDGIISGPQFFQFKNIDNLEIKNHVIYNYDTNDLGAENLCNRVLDNYNCNYVDSDNSNSITTGDIINITKNGKNIERFVLSTDSYKEPVFTHLGKISLSYTGYPDVALNNNAYTLYFNENNTLSVNLQGNNYNELSTYDVILKIGEISSDKEVYSSTQKISGKQINEGMIFNIESKLLKSQKSCDSFYCDPQYFIQVIVDGEVRGSAFSYIDSQYQGYSFTIDDNENVMIEPNVPIIAKKIETHKFEILPKAGYIIHSIKVNGEEKTQDYNNGTIVIENTRYGVYVEVEVTPEQYEFVEGANSTYINNSMKFKINGPLELFKSVYVNNQVLNDIYYSAISGSTILTLNDNYLKQLSPGLYVLTVNYSNGTSAKTIFKKNATLASDDKKPVDNIESINSLNTNDALDKVKEEAKSSANPKTADSVLSYFGLFVISLLSMLGISCFSIKRD